MATWTTIGIANNSIGPTLPLTVGGSGVIGGSCIVVIVHDRSTAGSPSLADSQGNSYALVDSQGLNGSRTYGTLYFFRAFNSIALSAVDTITYTKGGTGNLQCALSAMSTTLALTASDPVDGATVATNFGTNFNPNVTSGVPTLTNELFVGAVGIRGTSGTFTQDSANAAWVTPPDESSSGTSSINARVNGGSVIDATTATRTYAPNYSVSEHWAAIIVGFKPFVAVPLVVGWLRGEDSVPRKPLYQEAPPALALTPATVPPKIAGMAWHEPPDPLPTRPLYREQLPAFAPSPRTLPPLIGGMAWFEREDIVWPGRRYKNDPPAAVLTPVTLPPPSLVIGWLSPPDNLGKFRPPTVDTQAFAPSPATLPAKIAGIGWFQPPDPLGVKPLYREQREAIGFNPAAFPPPIAGMAWHTPTDVFWPGRHYGNEPPAFTLPTAVTVGIAGMAWFAPLDAPNYGRLARTDPPTPVFQFPQPATFGFSVTPDYLRKPLDRDHGPSAFTVPIAVPVGISGMAWFEPWDAPNYTKPRFTEPGTPFFQAPPLPFLGWSFPLDLVPRKPRYSEALPGIALTPTTLPPQFSGVAWFQPPAAPNFIKAARTESAGWAPSTAPVFAYGWFVTPETVNRKDAVAASVIALPILLPPTMVTAFGWSHGDDILPGRNRGSADVEAFTVPAVAAVGISGMAWFIPPEGLARSPAPAHWGAGIALTPLTLPVGISGMGWFAPADNLPRAVAVPPFQIGPGYVEPLPGPGIPGAHEWRIRAVRRGRR